MTARILLLLNALSLGAAATEPLSVWQEAVEEAAVAQGSGDYLAAEGAARAALAARPAGEAAARAELALGLALCDQGRFSEAEAALRLSAGGLGNADLEIARASAEAHALLYGGHPGAAALVAAEAARADWAGAARARWREVDALVASGLLDRAAAGLRQLIEEAPADPAVPGARLSLASILLNLGRETEAVELLHQIWLELPEDPAADSAGAVLARLRAAGHLVGAPLPDERLDRASRLLSLAMPARALSELEGGTYPGRLAPRASLIRALALSQTGRREEATSLARSLVACPDPAVRAGADLVLARAAARAKQVEEAVRWYRALARNRAPVPGLPAFQQRSLADEAAYLAAWTYYDAGQLGRAARLLEAYERAHPRAHRADDARWFRAWSFLRLGRTKEARAALSPIRKGRLRSASLYWQARLSSGRTQAVSLFSAVLREEPDGWYALLARSRMAELGAPAPAATRSRPWPPPETPGDPQAARALARASAFIGAGMREEGLSELRALSRGGPARVRASSVAQLAAFVEDAEIPYRLGSDVMPAGWRSSRLAHPLAFPVLVPKTAAAYRLDPLLLLAVMLRESGFREHLRSTAGAEGLLQLLPETAERLASMIGIPAERADRLHDPEVAVPMGAYYLSLLAARFGEPALAVAAYNAGPNAVARWAQERAGIPLDEWVEEIPFRETRQYVKVVMSSYATYRRLYGSPLVIDPEWKVVPPREGVSF